MAPTSWKLALFLLMNLPQFGSMASVKSSQSCDYPKYHSMDEIHRWMRDVEQRDPDVVSSAVYGHTYENRTITLLKLGLQSPEGREKKVIWVDCIIPAHDWVAPAFCQWFVKEIVQSYKKDKKLEQMLQNLDLYVTPVIDVDGYVFTWVNDRAHLFIKPRPTLPGSSRGVDLNRTFTASWGSRMANQTLCFLTIHSAGQRVLHLPYGHPEISSPNHNELVSVGLAAAEEMKKVRGMSYTVGTSPKSSVRDRAHLIGIPFSYTFELGDKGQLGRLFPAEQIRPTCEEAYAGALSIITYVHDKTFYNGGLPNSAVTTMTIWSTILAVSLATGLLV